MSEIAKSLLAQEAAGEEPDVGKVFKKLLGDNAPVIDAAAERTRFKRDRLQELEEALRAESQKR